MPTTQGTCAVCGGDLVPTAITHEEHRGGKLYIFHNVPAQVCRKCGEIWIAERVLQEIDRLIDRGRPDRFEETPVFDFALTPAR